MNKIYPKILPQYMSKEDLGAMIGGVTVQHTVDEENKTVAFRKVKDPVRKPKISERNGLIGSMRSVGAIG